MYKSTHDSNNLCSLGCVIITIALQDNCSFSVLCFLYNLLYNPCEWGKLMVCLAPRVLCCTGTTQILLRFGMMYQQVCLHCALMDSSIFLCQLLVIIIPLSVLQDNCHGLMCKPEISLLGKDHPNQIKVDIQAGPWSVWLKYISSKFIHLNFAGCHWFHIWKHHVSSFRSEWM